MNVHTEINYYYSSEKHKTVPEDGMADVNEGIPRSFSHADRMHEEHHKLHVGKLACQRGSM